MRASVPYWRLLGLIGISLLLGACVRHDGPETFEQPEPLEIAVFAQQEGGHDLATNAFSKLLEDKFNVRFRWEIASVEGAREKRQISLAGGDYPEAYILTSYIDQFSQSDVLKYGKQGVFLPLNELIDRHAPHIKAAMADNPGLKALNTAPDGNIYGLVAYSDCFHCSYPNKLWINTDWLERLQLDTPSTTEQFKRMLQAFKHEDPNGNGIPDEVPLSGSTEDYGVRVIPFLMNGFIYHDDRSYLHVAGGKVGTVANKPEWREGLAYIRSLYEEGLLDPGAFTQNADSLKRLGEQEEDVILGAAAAMHPDIFVGSRTASYAPLPPLRGPYAAYATYIGGGVAPGAKFVITDKASPEAQIALIRMADYMFTPEGQTIAQAGPEGTGWRQPAAGEEALGEGVEPKFAAIPLPESGISTNAGWSGMGHFYMPRDYRESWVASRDLFSEEGYERRLHEATLLYEGHEPEEIFPLWAIWIPEEAADEADIVHTNLVNYIRKSTLQFVTGYLDLDTDWDDYVQELNDLLLPRYLDIMQQAYDRLFPERRQ